MDTIVGCYFCGMKKWFTILLAAVLFVCCKEKSSKANQPDQAKLNLLKELRLKVQQNPDSASIRMSLVNALDSLQMYTEAIGQTDSLIKRDSLNNGLWFARAQLLESKKDTVQAISNYEKALSIYPSVEAQLNLANLYAETKNPRALVICQNVSRMGLGRETDAGCDFVAGVYHARIGSNDKAIVFFDRAINNNYTLMEAYMEKGFVYYEEKKYADALKVFETAITITNTYADAYYWKAKTQEAMGDKEQALLNYERSLGLDRQLKEAREAINRLK